jgi:hypothetical protein
MTEKEMQDYIELFDNDGDDPIYSFWDVRTDDKRLLIASHNPVLVCRYIMISELATAEEKQEARGMLGLATEDEEKQQIIENAERPLHSIAATAPFLVSEVDWDSLSMERRKGLLAACGYQTGMWEAPWNNMLYAARVLLARELERVSGGTATLAHDWYMEEMRHEPGWEASLDPRLRGKAELPSEVEAPQPSNSMNKRRPRAQDDVTPTPAKGKKTTRKRKE